MGKAVLYIRANNSLEEAEEQLGQLWAFAEAEGYQVINAYYEVVSGVSNVHERTIWNMLKDARKNLFDTVIIRDITRISRKEKDALLVLNELDTLGIKLVSQHGNIEQWNERTRA